METNFLKQLFKPKRSLYLVKPYNKVDFGWVSSHHDIHLKGTCFEDGELCEFEAKLSTSRRSEVLVSIYKIDLLSKLNWYKKQRLFELCVGYHWTYPQRLRGDSFYYRKPIWFYKLLFKLYYKLKKK